MKATSQYLKYLMEQRAMVRQNDSVIRRMHDLGIEPRREPEPLPAWAEAFGEKLQRYFYGGIEAEHAPTAS